MEKIEVSVLGLSSSPAGNNAYSLILKELEGERRMPIIIGAFEAQAIALEMEGVMPPRPMTHDLFKDFIKSVGAELTEVFINDLIEGTFYSKLIFDSHSLEIDSRPSDAIAMAVRFNAPIYVNSTIIEETGIIPNVGSEPIENMELAQEDTEKISPKTNQSKLSVLQQKLDKAISDEEYEKAASLRDKIKILLENQ